jgi:hypothetical protein
MQGPAKGGAVRARCVRGNAGLARLGEHGTGDSRFELRTGEIWGRIAARGIGSTPSSTIGSIPSSPFAAPEIAGATGDWGGVGVAPADAHPRPLAGGQSWTSPTRSRWPTSSQSYLRWPTPPLSLTPASPQSDGLWVRNTRRMPGSAPPWSSMSMPLLGSRLSVDWHRSSPRRKAGSCGTRDLVVRWWGWEARHQLGL